MWEVKEDLSLGKIYSSRIRFLFLLKTGTSLTHPQFT